MAINELSESNIRTIASFFASEADFRSARPQAHHAARKDGYLETLTYRHIPQNQTKVGKKSTSPRKKGAAKPGRKGDPTKDPLFIKEVARREKIKKDFAEEGYDYRYEVISLGFNLQLRGHELKVTSNLDLKTLKPRDRL